ncbi:MAG TPA: MoxR family ATPase [Petrotogaceae bacterium]|jgi:MoxR-like ATPase|nr:MoxR family ATPase [Petrotogaceae bacterium]HPA94197.1 MoxR family ATPase [Petrotogaceae bacterium]HQO13366.1 MoxR family ATPase [Petrotogaceae bacterium]HQP59285.1 MoxR family ATPase [Petrotogaceae bacterium]
MKSSELCNTVVTNVAKVIKGKEDKIKLLIAAFLSSGHVLIEDVPGTGKTVISRAISKSIGLGFKRVQFTPDLLPGDLTGLYIFNRKNEEFLLKKGPVFTEFLLADEINRATPRTQSALLEALAERQITIDGITHQLSNDFFVMATQNPVEFEGTFPLPEAQLDRFMIKTTIGYPDFEDEIKMLSAQDRGHPLDDIQTVVEQAEIVQCKKEVNEINISPDILSYITRIVDRTRKDKNILLGSSPRGSINLMKISKAFAAMDNRSFVIPDDVKYSAKSVLVHRIILKPETKIRKISPDEIMENILSEVEVIV